MQDRGPDDGSGGSRAAKKLDAELKRNGLRGEKGRKQMPINRANSALEVYGGIRDTNWGK